MRPRWCRILVLSALAATVPQQAVHEVGAFRAAARKREKAWFGPYIRDCLPARPARPGLLSPPSFDAHGERGRMVGQLAPALPPQGGEIRKSRQSNALAAFLTSANCLASRKPILSSSRRVSMTLSCDRFALALRPSMTPIATRSGCSRSDVVRGATRQASAPKPLRIRQGRTNQPPLPSSSVPTLTPRRHHQISRTV